VKKDQQGKRTCFSSSDFTSSARASASELTSLLTAPAFSGVRLLIYLLFEEKKSHLTGLYISYIFIIA
jgi:hypothetical protein